MAVDITTLGIELDTSDLRRGKKDLDAIGDSANKTAGKVSSFTSTATKALGTFAAAFAGAFSTVSVAQKLIETERSMGVLNASLITATGSAETTGQAFKAIQELASRLPESVDSVAEAFIKMRNLGLDPSQKAIESYSNTAAAMGKSLNQMVEAVADAATGEFERLKEFGIKAKQQGDEVSFTFQGVTKTVQKNSEEITKYLQEIGNNNFAGAAAARMQTLDGAISNLQDSWDGLFRTINSQGTGTFITDTVRAAAEAVQDLSDSIASGQLSAYLDAFASKFQTFSDAGVMAFEMLKIGFDSFVKDLGAGNNVADFIVGAFRDMPENIAAFIKIAAVEIAVLVDKAMVYGEQIAWAMNPANWFSDAPDISGRLDAINEARQSSITDIMAESDAALKSYDDQINAADALLAKYELEKSSVIDLGQFKVQANNEVVASSAKAVQSTNEQAEANARLAQSIDSFAMQSQQDKQDLDALIESVDNFGGAWSRTGSIIADTFGSIGDALDDYVRRIEDISKIEEGLAEKKKKFFGDPKELDKIAAAEKKLASERTKANISSYRSIAGAASEMFDEQSKARKTLHGLEMAFGAIEMAMTIQKSILSAKEAVLNQGKGDPYTAWARMAAMAAVVAAIGYGVGGIGGGGGGQSAQQIQESQGTGSVLGSNDKSESLANAFETYSEIGLEQLGELRKIRDGLTGLSGGIDKLSIGVAVSGLTEAKYVNFANQYVGDIIRSGIVTRGSRSQDVAGREMLSPLQGQISGIFGFIQESINAATGALEVAQNNPAWAFISDIGKVSFEGLSGEEIQQELNAIFSQQADLITEFVVPAMKEYQQMGEGLFETLTRVAAEMATFNYYTDALGLSFSAVGLSAIDVQQNIADLSGGMDKLTENMQTYYEEFFTEEERAAKQMELLTEEMKNLGYDIVPSSREGFRNLVTAIDLTTEAGQKQFAGLMSLSEVFAELVPATESLVEVQRSAADIAQERASLERQLLQAMGDTAALRALDLAALDESNRALQEQVWALQDQAASAREAEAAARTLAQAQAAIANQRYNLETQLLTLQGDTAALRVRELEKLDESNRALQLQIWAIEDQKEALQASAKAMADQEEERLRAEEESKRIAEEAAKAQEKILEDARRAAEEQRKLAQGVHDSISDALRSLMGESETMSQITQAQARKTLQNALGLAQAGGSLVGFAGLDEALKAIQKTDASRFSSAFEYNQAIGQNIGLLSQLEKYTRVNGSHANGLDYVPFDGYVAQLHKGERVMTASENKQQGELIAEIRALRSDLKSGDAATNGKLLSLVRMVEKWDGDGLPLERVS